MGENSPMPVSMMNEGRRACDDDAVEAAEQIEVTDDDWYFSFGRSRVLEQWLEDAVDLEFFPADGSCDLREGLRFVQGSRGPTPPPATCLLPPL